MDLKIKAQKTILSFKGLQIFDLVITTKDRLEQSNVETFIEWNDLKEAIQNDKP